MSRITLPVKYSSEAVSTVFDFISRLGVSQSISTATMTVTVYSGNESSPSLTAGSGSISGTKVTSILSGGLLGATYNVQCAITTSLGQTLDIQAFQVISPVAS